MQRIKYAIRANRIMKESKKKEIKCEELDSIGHTVDRNMAFFKEFAK